MNYRKTLTVSIQIILLTICFSPLLSSAYTNQVLEKETTIKNNNEKTSITYTFEQPTLTPITINNTTYYQVNQQENPNTGNPGEPQLPIKTCQVLLPKEKIQGQITIHPSEKITLGQHLPVIPTAESIPLSSTDDVSFPKHDKAIYESINTFPQEIITDISLQNFRGFNILFFGLYSVHSIPALGELFYYPQITIEIEMIPTESPNSLFRGLPEDIQDVTQIVDNPNNINSYLDDIVTTKYDDTYDLLIITNATLSSGYQTLANFHNTSGLPTRIKLMGIDIPLGSNYNETCVNIRTFIRKEYNDSGIKYVLLGGDNTSVPSPYLYFGAVYDEIMHEYLNITGPSDVYYACLNGPYNNDGDNRWGEPNDGEGGGDVDLTAEVAIGRACTDTLQDVDYFVQKTIGYITRNLSDDYFRKLVFAGEKISGPPIYTWGGNYLDHLINGSSAYGYITEGLPNDVFSVYDFDTLYDRDWQGNYWPKQELINRINNEVHIINHKGHAWANINMKLYVNDVLSLHNEKNFFVYSQSCSAGAFDWGIDEQYQDCMAEYFTVKTPHGAFAGIWNTRLGWSTLGQSDSPSQKYLRQFWDAVFGENITVISKANQDSKTDLIPLINQQRMRWCFYEITFFGDPTVEFKLPNPTHNVGVSSLNVAEHVKPNSRVNVNVTIINSGQNDENDVLVRLFLDGEVSNQMVIPEIEQHTLHTLEISFITPSAGIHSIGVNVSIPGVEEEYFYDNEKQRNILVGILNNNTHELFNTIQDALNDQETLDGHVILVPAGEYKEDIIIQKNISLLGHSRNTTVLTGRSQYTPQNIPPAVLHLKNTQSVLIKGFTIKDGFSYGIFIEGSINSTIMNTQIINNHGIGIYLKSSTYCVISNNDIIMNKIGIKIDLSSNHNTMYHNNFINNSRHAYDDGINQWSTEYPSGGNYWSGYTGRDNYRGPSQNEPLFDGIGDTPYQIPGGAQDRYPFMFTYDSSSTIINLNTTHRFTSIQNAIDDISTTNGDVLLILSKLYNEHVIVTKSVKLIGQYQNTTIIDATLNGSVLQIRADNVTIFGFTLQDTYDKAIDIRSRNNDIQRNIITGDINYAIYLENASQNIISNNIILNPLIGITLVNSTENMISDNLINITQGIPIDIRSYCNNTPSQGIFLKGMTGEHLLSQ
ncbi:MAG: C25 family cysteine peptidase [Methanobacteriota archaeon]